MVYYLCITILVVYLFVFVCARACSVNRMIQKQLVVYGRLRSRYLENSAYSDGLSKEKKRNFRGTCKENVKIENGQLFHRRCDRKNESEQDETDELKPTDEWKLCILTEEEKVIVLRSCRSSATTNW